MKLPSRPTLTYRRLSLIIILFLSFISVALLCLPINKSTDPILDRKSSINIDIFNRNNKLKPNQVAMVTYYKPQTDSNNVHFKHSSYNFLKYSLTNIYDYCQHHAIPFFYNNEHLVDTQTMNAYWGKTAVIHHYFKFGYDWIIWTDVDVLFWNKNNSIIDIWVQKAQDENKHVALVKECSFSSNNSNFGAVRSGFLAVRNTVQGQWFLNQWIGTFEQFKTRFNPDQEALEDLVQQQVVAEILYIANPDGIHTYGHCRESYDRNVTSVHYPGPTKANIINDAEKLGFNENSIYINLDF